MHALWIALISLLTAAPAGPPEQPTHVFLLIGQSNMAGRAALSVQDAAPIPAVRLLNAGDEWEVARQPLNRYASDHKGEDFQRFNLGGPFAAALRGADPNTTPGLIVNARGGTRIESWLPGETLYENTLKRVRALDGVELAGVLWHQGESNRDDPGYALKLEKLVLGLRGDLGMHELPFIAGHIAGENVINEQMNTLARKLPHMAVVTVEGLTLFDDVHFDRDSLVKLGQRYTEAYLQLTLPGACE